MYFCYSLPVHKIDSGISSSKLEADVRSSQKIRDDWIVDGAVSDTMAAFISYPKDRSSHVFSVNINRPGLSFGYFFRGGGRLSGIENSIMECTVAGYNERAFISLNKQKVNRLEIDDGSLMQTLDIDSSKPFVIVLPVNCGILYFVIVTAQLYIIGTICL